MSTAILEATKAEAPNWIISKRDDLMWFIGGSLLGYGALLALSAGFPILPAFLFWTLLIDGPHVWSTTSRTYFDKTARRRLGAKLWLVFPLLLVGPVFHWFGADKLFLFGVVTWAQYHIAKQHLGFVMLYKRKTGENCDFMIDRRFLVASFMLPWSIFAVAEFGVLSFAFARGVLSLCVAGYVAFMATYLWHQYKKQSRGEILNIPKLLLLALVVPLQWAAFLYAIGRPSGIIIAGIATNIGHSLQYLRLTWFHNQNRYAHQPFSVIGIASIVNRRWICFLGAAVVLNLIASLPRLFTGPIIISLLMGINLTHYYVDSLIWKTRSDKGLAKALRL